MNSKHSPLPWHADTWYYEAPRGDRIMIISDEIPVAEIVQVYREIKSPAELLDVERANAQFILRAVNHHDELVKALKAVLGCNDYCYGYANGIARVTQEFSDILSKAQSALNKLEAE